MTRKNGLPRPSYKAKERVKRVVWAVLRSVFVAGFCFIILYPVINMISRSLMSPVDLYDNTILWLPKHVTADNFRVVAAVLDYGRRL